MRELKPLDPTAESPQDIWFDYFEKRTPNGRTVRELVFNLHEAKKHDHVIALIEAALSNGHIYSWMYEVLAITYELDGRPPADVERALLSAVDPSVDFESMMFSSAFLSRFNNKKPALRMYRQASRQNPVRPEPYILGLRLARDLEDIDAIEWSVVGILNYAWSKDYETLHKEAIVAAKNALVILKKAGDQKHIDSFQKSISDARTRDLVIEVRWNGNSDVDLAVEGPKGTLVDWQNTQSISGGVHVHDGFGPKQENCIEKYVCVKALPGQYFIRVNHVWGNIVAGRVSVKVIKYQGTKYEKEKIYSTPIENNRGDLIINLDKGRRENVNENLKKNQQSRLELWQHPSRNITRGPGVGPQRLTMQQRQVLQQFLGTNNGGGQGGRFGGGFVGPAAIGIAPTISQVFEGSVMGASAVISNDRRYVRIGINATFQRIVDVFNYSLNNGSSMRANGN
ncbi:hypothetical protein OAK91_00055 [Planctomycetaceae bacterium]|nr:hypothetical protein [bacterium]MDB4786818.1 hypothetical protein [Planctomycetaceae bacterium]MDC0273106.1 hypothetical protein [Planctomycetaceae bacterium]